MCLFPIQHKLHVKYQNHYTETEMLSFWRCFHHWLAVAAKKVVKMTTFIFNVMERQLLLRRNNHSYLTDRDPCSYWSRRSVLQNRKVAIINITGLCLNGELSTHKGLYAENVTHIYFRHQFFSEYNFNHPLPATLKPAFRTAKNIAHNVNWFRCLSGNRDVNKAKSFSSARKKIPIHYLLWSIIHHHIFVWYLLCMIYFPRIFSNMRSTG